MLKKISMILLFVTGLTWSAFAEEPAVAIPAAPVVAEAPKTPGEAVVEAADANLPKAADLLQILPTDLVLGNKDATVTIIEYASMSCSHCAAFHNDTFADLRAKYIDTGKVRFVFRDFPLDEPALRGGMLARCAGKEGGVDNFIKFNKVLFSSQENWAPKPNYLEVLSNIAKLGGMKGEAFDACIADKDLEAQIMEGKFNAVKVLEVRSTPTFFINGVMHKGAKGLDYFTHEIDLLLGVKDASAETPAANTPKAAGE